MRPTLVSVVLHLHGPAGRRAELLAERTGDEDRREDRLVAVRHLDPPARHGAPAYRDGPVKVPKTETRAESVGVPVGDGGRYGLSSSPVLNRIPRPDRQVHENVPSKDLRLV